MGIWEELRRNWKWIIVYLLFPVSQLLIFSGVDTGASQAGPWWTNRRLLICLIGLLSADVIFGVATWQQINKMRLKRQLGEEELLLAMRRKANEEMERQREELEGLKESYRRQLMELLELVESDPEKARIQLGQFQKRLNDTKIFHYCGNDIVNAVISKYDKMCRDLQISFEAHLVLDGVEGIEPVHLCSIFSNLLDNAVHACERIEETDRWIKIDADMRGDYIHISARNSARKEQKKDTSREHYGLKILEDIARIYEGNFSSGLQGGEYQAEIVLLRKEACA